MTCCAVCREPIVFEGGKWVRLARGEHIADPAGDQHGGHAPEQGGPFAELSPPYSTIVADPPWHYAQGGPTTASWSTLRPPAYSMMATEDIAALPVGDLAAPDAHLWLWTTNAYLRAAFDIAAGWGFRHSQTLTWCKPPRGIGPGGAFSNTTETHPNPLQLALTLEEPEFQPHYAAWVRHLGHAPAPGEGGNAQFIAWIHAMWTQWETETGLSREYDRDEFLPWLEAQTESSNR